MKKYAIIVAGGSGQRMGASIPKQFLLLRGKPVLYHTIKAFTNVYADIEIVLVLPAEFMNEGEKLIEELNANRNIRITMGGDNRFKSVKNGLQLVHDNAIVFVHDGVRCLVSKDLIERCYEQALSTGSAVPAVAATDSIRVEENNTHRVIDRNHIRIIQTPQTFQSALLLKAFQQEYQSSFTDEATVVEAMGKEVFLVEGEYENLKITRPIDLFIAEKILEQRTT